MNIIYKLTNLDKSEGRRFYVGSKVECFIENINGIDRIVSSKTGLPYYGSSTCPLMKEDMSLGDRFHAEVLEEVPDKKNLLEVENKWIKQLNAVESPEYYNISYAIIGGHMIDQTAAYNMYGETIVGYGKATSSINKKHNTAKKYGYKNVGEFSLFIHRELKSGKSSAEIAKDLNWERHAPALYIKGYDMDKCEAEYDPNNENIKVKIRKLVAEGVSTKRIAELEGLEIPTVCLYIGEYDDVRKRSFLVAQRRGQTKEELEIQVTKLILDGKGFTEVSRQLSINETSVKRYFLRCIRSKIKSSDLGERIE